MRKGPKVAAPRPPLLPTPTPAPACLRGSTGEGRGQPLEVKTVGAGGGQDGGHQRALLVSKTNTVKTIHGRGARLRPEVSEDANERMTQVTYGSLSRAGAGMMKRGQRPSAR